MNYPKIGIRPTIDGRRKGIRESLEDQTMNMAKQAAELFTATLRDYEQENKRLEEEHVINTHRHGDHYNQDMVDSLPDGIFHPLTLQNHPDLT